MSRKARNRAAVAAVILLVVGGALAFGQLKGTFAIFQAETENQTGVFQGSWIPAPSAATSSYDGTPYSQEHLAWTTGHAAATPSPNPITGQTILYADGGSTQAGASCGSYSSFSSVAATATTADLTGTNLTDWWCFEVQSTSAAATTSGSWTSDVVTFTPRRILVVTGVAIANGGTAGRIDTNDLITITFNQNVNLPAANRFCAVNTGLLIIGDTRAAGTCAAADTYTIGEVTGLTVNRTLTGAGLSETVSQPAANKIQVKITSTPGTVTTATGAGGVFASSTSVTDTLSAQPACISASAPVCTVNPSVSF